jgi:hypothetical protein
MKLFLLSLTSVLALVAAAPAEAAPKPATSPKMCWTITDTSRLTGYSEVCGSEKIDSVSVPREHRILMRDDGQPVPTTNTGGGHTRYFYGRIRDFNNGRDSGGDSGGGNGGGSSGGANG